MNRQFMWKQLVNLSFLFIFIIASGFTSILPVQASSLSEETQVYAAAVITDCPDYDEFLSALNANPIVSFSLTQSCTIRFDDEIDVNGYVSIQNLGNGELIFDGHGDVVIDYDDDDENDYGNRLFNVSSTGSLYLENVTLENGYTDSRGGAILNNGGRISLERVTLEDNEALDRGGALYNSGGTITINESTFKNNQTTDGDDFETGNGGAMYNTNFSGTMSILVTNSTFEGNQTGNSYSSDTGHGGAVYNFNVGGSMSMNIFNSTFTRNHTGNSSRDGSGDGGAIYSMSYGSMTLSVFNSTFSGNMVGSDTDGEVGDGGALYIRNSTLSMAGTILANSQVSSGGSIADCDIVDGYINDGGYNMIEDDGTCEFSSASTVISDPGLYAASGNYGGETETIPLNGSSPAVDMIPVGRTAFGVSLCGYDYAAQDQRGEYRPGGSACDLGAYELVDDAHPYNLPAAGFAPGEVSQIGASQVEYAVLGEPGQNGGMQIQIPSLGVQSEVLGVPKNGLGWDVTWLGDQVGYLNGTTFPTWDGNAVLAGHSYNQTGLPSVFNHLSDLKFGDEVWIQAWGQTYVYTVRTIDFVEADDLSVLTDKDENMVTLITCSEYDPEGLYYTGRTVVQAYLTDIR